MEKITLLETEKSIAKRITKSIKYKTAFLAQKRFGTAVTAACIAMVLWSTGVFSWTTMLHQSDTIESLEQEIQKLSWQNQTILHDVSEKYQQIWQILDRSEEMYYGKK